jgi:hypothetical protein
MSKQPKMESIEVADLMGVEGGRGRGHYRPSLPSLTINQQFNQAGVVVGQQGTNNGTVDISGNTFNF